VWPWVITTLSCLIPLAGFEVSLIGRFSGVPRGLGHSIFTEAETWDELRANVLEATSLHFEAGPARPRLVQLHYVKDELLPVEAA